MALEANAMKLLDGVTASGAGTAQTMHAGAKGDTHSASVVLFGTFVGTVAVQVSANGTDWVTAVDEQGNAISMTTPGTVVMSGDYPHIRGNATAFTSGTINLWAFPKAG